MMCLIHKPGSLNLPHRLLSIALLSILIFPLSSFANSTTDGGTQSAPRSSVNTNGTWRRADEASRSLTFEVPPGKTSRLAVAGDRITSAVYDQMSLDVKTESTLGQLFVLPIVAGEAALYVTTESGASIPVILEVTEDANPQNIVLTRSGANLPAGTDTRSPRILAPLPVSDYVSAVKYLVRHALLELETPDVLRRGACPQPSNAVTNALLELSALTPKVLSCWSTTGLSATVIRVRNPRLAKARIDPAALTGGSILAAAVEKEELGLGHASPIVLVEPGDDE